MKARDERDQRPLKYVRVSAILCSFEAADVRSIADDVRNHGCPGGEGCGNRSERCGIFQSLWGAEVVPSVEEPREIFFDLRAKVKQAVDAFSIAIPITAHGCQ